MVGVGARWARRAACTGSMSCTWLYMTWPESRFQINEYSSKVFQSSQRVNAGFDERVHVDRYASHHVINEFFVRSVVGEDIFLEALLILEVIPECLVSPEIPIKAFPLQIRIMIRHLKGVLQRMLPIIPGTESLTTGTAKLGEPSESFVLEDQRHKT